MQGTKSAVVIGTVVCWLSWTPLLAQSLDTLVLLYTGGAFGYLEACPCSKENLGGLARRMTLVMQTRAAFGEKVVLVDAGNQFSTYPKSREEAALVANLLAAMQYDAINLAEYDLTYGLDFAKVTLSTLPVVSTNLSDKQGATLAPRYRIKRIRRVSIAFIGVLTESAFANAQDSAKMDARLEPALPALERTLESLRKEAPDLTVLLLRTQDIGLEKKLAERFPQLSVIITNSEEFLTETPSKVGSTFVLSAGHDGEYIGRLMLILNGKEVIKAENALIPLSPKVQSDPKMEAAIQAFKQSQKRKQKSVN
ncbi:MAG: hypothetical protein RMI34_08395 [Chloroherpetonaceae bacterium]|nr:hypothetical protein [Chloroherpetonaceae bacterium]MCS7211648.1 hypothetical protein [Chloroherpetonaceae bacterium]MDW8020078.1 hypothetical protein [Chloroherpetonaceae bacterium]MDW8464924.1 hypothetical protein [Chloroherpetonaceae bacterium]